MKEHTLIKKKIDLMIVGAQKSGTTSLLKLLGEHQNICIHNQGEFPFFVNDEYYNMGISRYWDEYFGSHKANEKIISKSAGLMYSMKALQRLKTHNPNVKPVLILRNPVDRAYSAYWFARRKGWETIDSFEEAFEQGIDRFGDNWIPKTLCNYLVRGNYAEHIKNLYKLFPEENVMIFKFEEFKKNEIEVCRKIWKSLGLNDAISVSTDKKKFNSAAMPKFKGLNKFIRKLRPPKAFKEYLPMKLLRNVKDKVILMNETTIGVPPMKKETRNYLIEIYKEKNLELSNLTGWDLSDWNK